MLAMASGLTMKLKAMKIEKTVLTQYINGEDQILRILRPKLVNCIPENVGSFNATPEIQAGQVPKICPGQNSPARRE